MALFTGLILAVEGFVESWGLFGAFLIAVTESFIFPVPTVTFLAPMAALGMDPLAVTLVATVGSVFGALVGYFLGKRLGRPAANRLFKEKHVLRVENWFKKWGSGAIFLAAFTPIPFKVFTWCGGIFRMRKKTFLLAAIAGRFLQFALFTYAGSIFGPEVLAWLGGI